MPTEVEDAQVIKLLAEARHFDAQTANNDRESAATIAKTEAEARKLGIEADVAEINREREQLKHAEERASDKVHRVFAFNGEVNASSTKACIDQLTTWMRLDEDKDAKTAIEIVFNSPGGSVVSGMALWDFIQVVRERGHRVTTSTIGYAASMAGILLQAGDKRVMGRESWLLIHEASFGAGGKIGDVEDTVAWVKRVCDRIVDIFVARSGGKITKARFKNNWRRKDWWIDSSEALKLGFIDEVR